MFNKVLIANRGEIAVRIIRTLNRLGIKTVAVYSDADTNSLHVKMADEAVYIGPSPASQSYLMLDNILGAIRTTGAQAVHPGYGFLSENYAFAKALEKEGIALIGPSSQAIRDMGDKIEAKKLAQHAGVNTIPGYMGVIKNEKEALKIAADIGFPVMIKAAAGGGGKGMRVVRAKEEIGQAYSSATNEAKNNFSDDRIFIEKFIEQPRHIEIQVLADKFGTIVCLGERECSIQRHHQKVIEEAPSPFLDEKTRQKMYAQVTSLAKKVGYYSAGTVEFIVDRNKNFYFLEMNTRLQVEHCVTELITGIDIVEQMLLVAAGEKLSFTQKDVQLNGWAMESRIYAEDPSRGFLPSSGRINEYQEPAKGKHLRIDSGVYEGGDVSMFYDPMIAKLCSYGKTREEAIEFMKRGLSEFVISGVSHNISFLEALMAHPRFAKGDMSTNFIAEEYPDGFSGAELTDETSQVFLATAVYIYLQDAKRAIRISGQLPGRERQIGNRWVVFLDDQSYPVYISTREHGYDVRFDHNVLSIRSVWILGNNLFQGTLNGRQFSVKVAYYAGGMELTYAGSKVRATVRTPRVAELHKFMPAREASAVSKHLEAPISGRVVKIKTQKGDVVKSGGELIILEAMKMENVIYAERDVTIGDILVKEGDSVQADQVLVEFA